MQPDRECLSMGPTKTALKVTESTLIINNHDKMNLSQYPKLFSVFSECFSNDVK